MQKWNWKSQYSWFKLYLSRPWIERSEFIYPASNWLLVISQQVAFSEKCHSTHLLFELRTVIFSNAEYIPKTMTVTWSTLTFSNRHCCVPILVYGVFRRWIPVDWFFRLIGIFSICYSVNKFWIRLWSKIKILNRVQNINVGSDG